MSWTKCFDSCWTSVWCMQNKSAAIEFLRANVCWFVRLQTRRDLLASLERKIMLSRFWNERHHALPPCFPEEKFLNFPWTYFGHKQKKSSERTKLEPHCVAILSIVRPDRIGACLARLMVGGEKGQHHSVQRKVKPSFFCLLNSVTHTHKPPGCWNQNVYACTKQFLLTPRSAQRYTALIAVNDW